MSTVRRTITAKEWRRHQAGYWQAADTIALVHILSPESAGVVALAVATIALAARYVPITNHVVLGAAALAPYPHARNSAASSATNSASCVEQKK